MKYVGSGVGVILLKCKRIKSIFADNTKITGDITSHFLMLTLPASIYARAVGTETSNVIDLGFGSMQVEVEV